MALTKEEILDAISEMSVMDIVDLVKLMEEKFGVSAAAPVAAAAAPAAAGEAGAEPAEEQSEFEIFLADVGDKKIDVIKAVRTITGLGLKEAKAIVDGAPASVKEGANKEEADTAKSQLEEAGATVELK
jgi:large subunit ribosomal protein L7/L12